ncbi:putative RWP-RK domain-containing protein [Phytophthora cinnamomi]|uniref:putative RWP-RK domain-containing protein n=1 Tax=Phytophthora cinnamomi TaxID=4785 RepID=UPI0035594CCC|nr:putative RWP-RK domain-containing protein [Phytophthora cinnamomi]
MSAFSSIRSFPMQQYPQCQGFGGLASYAMNPAQERMALPPLNVLPSRAYGYSPMHKPMASPAASLAMQPAASPSKKRVRALPNASKSITLDMLRPHFEKPLAEVANIFGICMTLMKKICRKNGVPRWPHRQIRGLRKSIWSIEKALRCCESEAQRRSYNDHLQKQRSKLLTILKGPASPSSKAAFELVLSEPCSPMGDVATPTVADKAQVVSPAVHFQLPTPAAYAQPVGNVSPKLPSIASLLMKNEEQQQRPNYNYQF